MKLFQIQNRPRQLALSLLAAVFVFAYLLVFLPLNAWYADINDQIDRAEFSLNRYSKVAAGKPYWVARLEQIRQEGETAEHFITQDTAALASAQLQSKMKETVTSAGGELISTQVIPDHVEDQFVRIAVKVRLTGSTEVLRQVLHDTESSQPILFVENLNLRPIRLPPAPGQKNNPADKLSVDFDVVGYMLLQEGAS